MVKVSWWTCAVAALAALLAPAPGDARVLGRCELARELRRLGVLADHVATWVCIAFHESRFDTAARNPHSGDHGLLQISELYWCGAGKACGLPCDALRDDDIADDVQCALRVHRDHTTLQGDGFLAWVVYSQHCKQNTKKYLADCSGSSKETVKTVDNTRAMDSRDYEANKTFTLNPGIDELHAPYLSFNSKDNIGHGKSDRFKLQYGRLSNIDELSLPVFNQPITKVELPSISTTTTLKTFEPITMTESDQLGGNTLTTAKPMGLVYKSTQLDFTAKPTAVPRSNGTPTQSPASTTTTVKPITRITKQKYLTDVHKSTIATTKTTSKPITLTTSRYQNAIVRPNSYDFSKSIPVTLTNKEPLKQFTCFGCRKLSTAKPAFSLKQTTLYTPKTRRTITADGSIYSTVVRSTTPRTIVSSSTSRPWRTVKARTTAIVNYDNKAAIPRTNSIFDLYLNTERPKLTTYKFASPSDGWRRRRIFFNGTTSPATPLQRGRDISDARDNRDKVLKHFRL